MSIPPKYEDVVAKLDEALSREAALREELANKFEIIQEFRTSEEALRDSLGRARHRRDDVIDELDTLQQRLTVAEQLLRETSDYLDGSTRNAVWCDSILHKKMKAALKPAADAKPSLSCPNCKVCMGSPDFPENCLINGVKP